MTNIQAKCSMLMMKKKMMMMMMTILISMNKSLWTQKPNEINLSIINLKMAATQMIKMLILMHR